MPARQRRTSITKPTPLNGMFVCYIPRKDWWQLKVQCLEFNGVIERAKLMAYEAAHQRDLILKTAAEKYGFDWQRPFTMESDDWSIRQDPSK